MRTLFHWATLSFLVSATAVVNAQQYDSVVPNYSRTSTRVAYNTPIPSPTDTVSAVGSGVADATTAVAETVAPAATHVAHPVTIPQQGAVDMGAPVYSGPMSSYAAPAYSAGCSTGSCSSGACSTGSCSSGSCLSGACGGGGCLSGLGRSLSGGCMSCGSNSCGGGCLAGLGGLGRNIGGGNCCGWFGGLYYMHLWRDDDKFGYPIAFESANPSNTVLTTGSSTLDDGASGLGVRVGKMLNQNVAVEAIYWQVFPDDVTAVAQSSVLGGPVSSHILFNDLTYDSLVGPGPVPAADFFTDSQYMSVTRSYDYRNFELNFLRLPFVFGGCGTGGARIALLAGVRHFRAQEGLKIFSDDLNEIPGDDPNHELCYLTEVDNILTGFQVGGLLTLPLSSRLSGQFGTKVGVYNNRMEQTKALSGGAGGAIIGAGPDAGQPWAVTSKRDDVAFLGEFDLGASYCINNNWRATGGYKVLTIAGYAEAADQIPYTFNNLQAASLIHNQDSLILHGFYVGLERTW